MPVAVFIEIVVAINIARNVASRNRGIFALVAGLAPILEIIEGRGSDCIVSNLIGSVKYVLLPRPSIP